MKDKKKKNLIMNGRMQLQGKSEEKKCIKEKQTDKCQKVFSSKL